jgi:hypothetical protein
VKNLPVPKQSFRAEWQARYLLQVLFKNRGQGFFVGCKPGEIPVHQSTALRKTNLIGDDGSSGSDDFLATESRLLGLTISLALAVRHHRPGCESLPTLLFGESGCFPIFADSIERVRQA